MSRTKKGSKYPGIEVWSKRANGKCTGWAYGRFTKQFTASREREFSKDEIREALTEDATQKHLQKE